MPSEALLGTAVWDLPAKRWGGVVYNVLTYRLLGGKGDCYVYAPRRSWEELKRILGDCKFLEGMLVYDVARGRALEVELSALRLDSNYRRMLINTIHPAELGNFKALKKIAEHAEELYLDLQGFCRGAFSLSAFLEKLAEMPNKFYLKLSTSDLERFKVSLPENVVLLFTTGDKGAVLLSTAGLEYVNAPPVKVADTVGAGDVFFTTYFVTSSLEKAVFLASKFVEHEYYTFLRSSVP